MEIKYFVRTTCERVLDKSFSQIEYELLIDKEHKPLNSLISQFKITNNYNSVILEDDIILCKDFKKRIEEVIEKYPNKIINFFNYPNTYQGIKTDNIFCYMQCRYYPKGSCDIFIKNIENKLMLVSRPCLVLSDIAKRHNVDILQYRPHLVQHLDNGTLIMKGYNNFGNRRSPYFIDYLDELGITYEEAQKQENKEKLIALMQSKFRRL